MRDMQNKPFYWLNEESRKFLKRGYLVEGQSAEDRIKQIRDTFEKYSGSKQQADKFYDYMSKGWISLSSPIWSNYGTDRGYGISCFGGVLQDSTSDILRGIGEIGMLSKYGGGTAMYFGEVRPRGSAISKGGKTNGSVAFMKMYDSVMEVISQNSVRRGSMAAYLPIDHGDIEEFLTIRNDDSPIQNLSIAVTIPEGWMQSMIDGDKEKRKIWAKVLKKRSNTGYPYLFFEDNANNNKPQVYKDKNKQIKHSQLCVSGDQLVPSQHGMKTAFELYRLGGKLALTDGHKQISSSPMKLIKEDFVYEITLENGMTHKVTEEHKLKVYDPNSPSKSKIVRLRDVHLLDELYIQPSKGVFGRGNNDSQAFVSGYLQDKVDYIDKEVLESTENVQWRYIQGLIESDSCFSTVYRPTLELVQLDYNHKSQGLLRELQILLLNLGIISSVSLNSDREGNYTLTISNSKDCRKIHLETYGAEHYSSFIEKGELDEEAFLERKEHFKIVSIERKEKQPTYCVTVETDEHLWVCNGFITGNCSEIMEYTDEEKTFTCCLSSLNLKHFDEWKDSDLVDVMMRFLDTVLEEFIEKAEGEPFLEKTVKFAKEHRSVGLGVLGWHSYLQEHMMPMEGLETKMKINEIFKTINYQSLQASKELALEKGEPEMLIGYGERFTTRLALAPTTSSSFILGQVSPSIEPLNSNYFIKDLAKGKFVYKNPILKKVLKTYDKDNLETWGRILEKGGSVQHLDFLSQKEKDVFKTFGEISQLELLQNASIMQKYIDQGISLNLMIHPLMPVKEINKLMIEAWKLGLKTLYYQRSANLAQELNRKLMHCSSCEG